MAKPRILVIGNSKIDFLMKIKRMPEKNEKAVSNHAYSFVPNGTALISAVTACELGSDVVVSTRVGNDTNGEKLKDIYLYKGIDTRFVVVDKKRVTALDLIISEQFDSERIISCPSASAALSDEDLEEAFMSYPDAVLMHFDTSDEIIYEAVKLANSKNIPIMLDPVGKKLSDFDFDPLGNIEIFSPNVEETYELTGIIPDDVESCLHACIKIINMIKCHYVIIKLGAKGAFVFDGVYSKIVPTTDITVEDRGEVGSIFNAALLHAYLATCDIVSAAGFANAVSSLSLTKKGSFDAIPSISEVQDFINKNSNDFDLP